MTYALAISIEIHDMIHFNPCGAEFVLRNIWIYLYFHSFLSTDIAPVVYFLVEEKDITWYLPVPDGLSNVHN